MRPIEWTTFAPAFGQALLTLTVFCVAWTMVGMFVMKFFVRQVPILNHAAILFWATLRVQIVVLLLVSLRGIFGLPARALSYPVTLLALCAIGWLVTRDLSRKYGCPRNFRPLAPRWSQR